MASSRRPEFRSRLGRPRRRIRVALALVCVPLTLVGGAVVFGGPHPAAAVVAGESLREAQFQSALVTFNRGRLLAIEQVAVAKSVVASARLTLDASAGKVLDEEARVALGADIRLEDLRVAFATQELEQANRRSDFTHAVDSYFSERPGVEEATTTLTSIRFVWAANLATVGEHLDRPVQAVKDAVVAWQAEQARLAAEAAARAEAARAEAAQQEQARAARAAPFNKVVWTSGWQAEIDACRGAVNITGHYGVAVIAEHWSCGGSRFPRAGTEITLSGAVTGAYRVGGVVKVLNASTDGASMIPRGYDLLYQTCINGSNATMSFTSLTRIG